MNDETRKNSEWAALENKKDKDAEEKKLELIRLKNQRDRDLTKTVQGYHPVEMDGSK